MAASLHPDHPARDYVSRRQPLLSRPPCLGRTTSSCPPTYPSAPAGRQRTCNRRTPRPPNGVEQQPGRSPDPTALAARAAVRSVYPLKRCGITPFEFEQDHPAHQRVAPSSGMRGVPPVSLGRRGAIACDPAECCMGAGLAARRRRPGADRARQRAAEWRKGIRRCARAGQTPVRPSPLLRLARLDARVGVDAPHLAAASPSGLASTTRWVTEDGPHCLGEPEAVAARCEHVALGGRATSVPFTAVLTGPERTTTDNAKAVWTCTAHRLRRSCSRPNWLWEQGVAGSIWSSDQRRLPAVGWGRPWRTGPIHGDRGD
jgi:hypothetical protein